MRVLLFTLLISVFFCIGEKSNPSFNINVGSGIGEMSFDVFNRQRVAPPYTEGDYTYKYGIDPYQFGQLVTSNGTITADTTKAIAILSAKELADTAILQTHLYHRYQPSKGGEVTISISPNEAETDVVKRWGYFDDRNGLFYKLKGSSFYVCQRTDTTGEVVTNCVDSNSFNGTNYDTKMAVKDWIEGGFKATVFKIKFQWLGSGITNFNMLGHSGGFHSLHVFKNPHLYDRPYMRTATLPLRFEIVGSASATRFSTMNVICSSVISSGGEDSPEKAFNYALSNDTHTTSSADEEFVTAIRLKEKYFGQNNRRIIYPSDINIKAMDNGVISRVYISCTTNIIGGTWTNINTYSGAEYNETATSYTKDRRIGYYYLLASESSRRVPAVFGSSSSGFTRFKMTRTAFNDDSCSLIVTAQRITGDDGSISISINWGEVE